MTRDQRAAQLWSLLAFAARNQKILSYTMIEQLTGLPRHSVGRTLSHIQEHCKEKNLPPLQSLVVNQAEGVPGEGFTAAAIDELFKAHARVFVYDWLSVKPVPFPKEMDRLGKTSSRAIGLFDVGQVGAVSQCDCCGMSAGRRQPSRLSMGGPL